MFEELAQKLSAVFTRLTGQGTISEAHLATALREIRIALLQADVAPPVIKTLIDQVHQQALGQKIFTSISPGQMITKIIHDVLIEFLSDTNSVFPPTGHRPFLCLMIGLQGSGKTSMSAKLGHFFAKQGKRVLLVSLDTHRPAAQNQLRILAEKSDVDSLAIIEGQNPFEIAQRALLPQNLLYDIIIFDTAGRMTINKDLMQELLELKTRIRPQETLLVLDALTGQSALETTQSFHQAIGITGSALSRVDAQGRAGAALSLRFMTQKPLRFMGTGEQPCDGELFYPKRIADKILDQGDIVTLVTRAKETMASEEHAQALLNIQKGKMTLEDMLRSFEQIEKMGGMQKILTWLPGMKTMKEKMTSHIEQASFHKQKAIIQSMTIKERQDVHILNASRKKRIARGSGTDVASINRLLTQLSTMQKAHTLFKNMPGRSFLS